jgi:hypothetical protein
MSEPHARLVRNDNVCLLGEHNAQGWFTFYGIGHHQEATMNT